ncbi:MAG: sugar phosphate isomerase/epimerase [Clostridia bacterium]|nr:sugar phosphate isomerase/epimerase [Clostridia bacterium]
MKLGIIDGYTKDRFEYVKGLGLDFIEVCTNFDPESEDFIAAHKEIKSLIKEYDLPILSVGRWNANVIENNAIRRETVDMMKKEIEVAADIGSPVFNLGVNRDREQSLLRNFNLAAEYLSEMLEFAKKLGITLALYNCDWANFLCRDKTWDVILSEFPDLMIKYDCSHPYEANEDYLTELVKWAPRVAHMHVKGVLKVNGEGLDDPPAGIDDLPWPKIFAILYRAGYDKTLSIEPHSGVWQGELGERGVEFTVNYIRQFILR